MEISGDSRWISGAPINSHQFDSAAGRPIKRLAASKPWVPHSSRFALLNRTDIQLRERRRALARHRQTHDANQRLEGLGLPSHMVSKIFEHPTSSCFSGQANAATLLVSKP